MNAVLVLLGKEFSLYFRDKMAIVLTFMVPFLLIYIFGNIFSGGDGGGMNAKIKLAVLNASGSDAAIVLVESLQSESGLNVITDYQAESGERVLFTEASIRQGIVDHQFNFALIVPPGYIKTEGIGIRLKFISNPRNEIESQMVNGLIQKAVFTQLPNLLAPQLDEWQKQAMGDEQYNAFIEGLASLLNESSGQSGVELKMEDVTVSGLVDNLMSGQVSGTDSTLADAGDAESNASMFDNLLEIETDQVYGKEVKNPQLTRMIGGYAIMFLLFATTASATSLFTERDDGLFLRLLSMPVKRTHILWSKYLFNLMLGVVQALTLFIVASFFFDVQVFENFFTLLVVCVLSASACTAFGMLLSAIARTPQQAQGMGTLLILSMTSMSGAWIPLQWMPEIMQIIGKFSLVYWSIEGFRGALWESANLLEMAPTLGMIALYSAVLMGLSIWRFRKGQLFR